LISRGPKPSAIRTAAALLIVKSLHNCLVYLLRSRIEGEGARNTTHVKVLNGYDAKLTVFTFSGSSIKAAKRGSTGFLDKCYRTLGEKPQSRSLSVRGFLFRKKKPSIS